MSEADISQGDMMNTTQEIIILNILQIIINKRILNSLDPKLKARKSAKKIDTWVELKSTFFTNSSQSTKIERNKIVFLEISLTKKMNDLDH